MMRRTMTALTLTLMLSACGDDGKDVSSSKITRTAATKPAPTPTPTPATRTYTYETAALFNKDQAYIGYDRVTASKKDGKLVSANYSVSETASLTFQTNGGKVTLPDSSDLPNAGVYTAVNGNGTISAGSLLQFSNGGNAISLGLGEFRPASVPSLRLGNASISYNYIAGVSYESADIFRGFLVGSPTNPTEIAATGSLVYSALIDEAKNKNAMARQPLTLDLAKNTISGTIPLIADDGSSTDYEFHGAIDGTKHLSGSLNSSDGKVTGEFRGRLFGPAGKEIGLIVSLKQPDGSYRVALLTGALKQ
jgi:hypothetical protein